MPLFSNDYLPSLERTFDMGQQYGADLNNIAGECPFGHDIMDHRTAWMDGFAAARVKSTQALPNR
jgi:ribosome modulation factor